MGSGSSIKNVLTGGLSGAHEASKAQSQALQVQNMMSLLALQQQQQAATQSYELQKSVAETNNNITLQAQEKANKDTAKVLEDKKDAVNEADLTSGLATNPTLEYETLGTSDEELY